MTECSLRICSSLNSSPEQAKTMSRPKTVCLFIEAVLKPIRYWWLSRNSNCLRLAASVSGPLLVALSAFAAADDASQPAQYSADGIDIPGANAGEPKIELSMEKAEQYLHDGSIAWSRNRKCISCHTNGSYLLIRPALTNSLGPPDEEICCFFVSQLAVLKETPEKRLQSGTRPAQVIYIAAGLAEWDRHVTGVLSLECQEALELMFRLQQEDGSWKSLDCWPPFESSAYQEATMAAMAVAAAPGWLESLHDEELLEKTKRLKNYLRCTTPPHDYARVLKLWASLRLDGIMSADRQAEAVRLISKLQQDDGGWSIRSFASPEQWGKGNRAEKLRSETDFESPPSDGHMTGLAVLVMQESGIPNSDERLRKGVAWLRAEQRESGRWWTRSLNTDKSHFITYSGTAYAMLALQRAANGKTSVSKRSR